jgi:hypothetical protein
LWRTVSWLAPIVGVALFVVLHVGAAAEYPGGTRTDPARVGYSFAQNYWCDLMDATTYGGKVNPGRPLALAAMGFLCAGLAVLWVAAPALFPGARWRARVVRVAGIGCTLVAPWVGSSFHNLAVRVTALLGVTAFLATFTALRELRAAGAAVLVLVALTYFIWETGFGLPFLALVQKFAFAGALTWIVLVAWRVRGALEGTAPASK